MKDVFNNEVPMGFAMAMAENFEAMKYFASLANSQQQQIMKHAHTIGSKNEMRDFVATLGEKF